MKINGNNKKATVLTFNLKSMDTRMKLCAPSRLLPPHDDLNNLNEATITFDDWCEIDALIDALQRFSDENKRCAGYWEQQTIHTPYTPNEIREALGIGLCPNKKENEFGDYCMDKEGEQDG